MPFMLDENTVAGPRVRAAKLATGAKSLDDVEAAMAVAATG